MKTGVDDETRRTKGIGSEIADLAERIVVIHPKLVGDLFGIETPAFAIGGDRCRLAIERQLAVLELQRPFEQMPRRAFMIGEGGQRVARPFRGIAQVDEKDARARTVGGSRLRRPAGRADLDLGRDAADFIGRLGHMAEHLR